MRCFICKQSFTSANFLLVHIHLWHDHKSSYQCIDNNCFRLFSTPNSFRKHMIKEHTNTVNKIELHDVTAESEAASSINSSAKQQEKFLSKPNCPADVEAISCSTSACLKDVEQGVANFVSKMYNNSVFPRNLVQFVISNTSEFITYSYLPYLKQQLQNNLTSCETETVNKINTILDSTENPFQKFTTEYKCFQYYKKSSLFIMPEDIL